MRYSINVSNHLETSNHSSNTSTIYKIRQNQNDKIPPETTDPFVPSPYQDLLPQNVKPNTDHIKSTHVNFPTISPVIQLTHANSLCDLFRWQITWMSHRLWSSRFIQNCLAWKGSYELFRCFKDLTRLKRYKICSYNSWG